MSQRVLLPRQTGSQDISNALPSKDEEKRETPASSSSITRKRGPLVTAACNACRKRKIKCDGKKPCCNNCYKRNITCIYDETSKAERMRLLQERVEDGLEEINSTKRYVSLLVANVTDEDTRELFAQVDRDLDRYKSNFEQIDAEISARPSESAPHYMPLEAPIENDNRAGLESSTSRPGFTPHSSFSGSGNISVVIPVAGQSIIDSDPITRRSNETVDPQLAASGIIHIHQAESNTDLYGYAYYMLPLIASTYNEFSKSCILYQLHCQQLLAQGMSSQDVLGSDILDLSCLLSINVISPVHEFTAWIVSYFDTFPGSGNADWAFKVASIYCIFRVFRWLVEPTLANYKRIPDFMKPTPVQLFIPHSFWITFVVSPKLRTEFVLRPNDSHYQQWSWMLGNSKIDWPSTDISSMVVLHPNTNSFHLTPEFESTVNKIESWQLIY